MIDKEIRKLAKEIVRAQEREALERARRECLSEDQVERRMCEWREKHK